MGKLMPRLEFAFAQPYANADASSPYWLYSPNISTLHCNATLPQPEKQTFHDEKDSANFTFAAAKWCRECCTLEWRCGKSLTSPRVLGTWTTTNGGRQQKEGKERRKDRNAPGCQEVKRRTGSTMGSAYWTSQLKERRKWTTIQLTCQLASQTTLQPADHNTCRTHTCSADQKPHSLTNTQTDKQTVGWACLPTSALFVVEQWKEGGSTGVNTQTN